MKILNKFKRKRKIRNEMIMKEYEAGRILQVDNNIDNKEYLKKTDKSDEDS